MRIRRIWLWAFVWCCSAAVVHLGWWELYDRLWVGAVLVRWAVMLLGLGLACVAIWPSAVAQSRRKTLIEVGLLVTAGAAVWMALTAWAPRVRFELGRRHAESIVEAVRAGKQPPGHYLVDRGPPLQVAIPWPGGMLDNWCGAVWTERPRPAAGANLDAPVSCEPLRGRWWYCCYS